MSQLSGAFSVEIQLDRLADAIADRVLARLSRAGDDTYERPAEPDPGAGGRGLRTGSVTDTGIEYGGQP
jgi:hypothetical protein